MNICTLQQLIPSEEGIEPGANPPIAAILPGTICTQYVRCGKPTCICRTGKLHGPYHYRVWRAEGVVQKVYVRPEDVAASVQACAAYHEFSRALRGLRRELQMLTDRLERDVRRSRRLIERRSFVRAAQRRQVNARKPSLRAE